MKISKEEIIKLANDINIEVSTEEVAHIEASIMEITDRLAQLLAEDEAGSDRKILATENVNQFDKEHNNETAGDDLCQDLNNFDGQYFEVKKVIGDEE